MPLDILRHHPLRCLAWILLGSACDPQDEFSAAEQDADDAFRAHVDAMYGQFEIVTDDSVAARATGAVQVPLRSGGALQFTEDFLVRGTCGVTFVAPHFAVTAAHCVSSDNVPNIITDPVTVTQYDVSDVSWIAFALSSYVQGTFPFYEPLAPLEADDDYLVQSYSCSVSARCSTEFGKDNCAFEADIAMLYCPSRASNAAWLPIAPADDGSGDVEMYWFHELLAMPLTDPGLGDPEGHDHFAHYTKLSTHASNYHYLAGFASALVPLKSVPFPDGTPHRRVGLGSTDLYACHGTSGSGVLQRNASGNLELLGPTTFGWWEPGDHLCADPGSLTPGVLNTSYTSNQSTRDLQSAYSGALYWDRNPIVYWWPPHPPVFYPYP